MVLGSDRGFGHRAGPFLIPWDGIKLGINCKNHPRIHQSWVRAGNTLERGERTAGAARRRGTAQLWFCLAGAIT